MITYEANLTCDVCDAVVVSDLATDPTKALDLLIEEARSQGWYYPVSYTHLTLPTNREV